MAALVIGTAGHVDHGKTALVRALTGVDLDAQTGQVRPTGDRSSLDRLKDEQQRGITIDLGFAHTRIGEVDLAFVDVPGHERFVRNMLAGAGGFDAVLLVVAADESVKPQTREHAAICRLLGVARGVIALTKADLVDEDTLALTTLEVRELVAGSFLEGAPIVPVSARTGAGLDALVRTLVALDRAGAEVRRETARLPVDRAFSAKGFGTVVTGTLVSGRLAEGDGLALLPGGREVRIRGLHVHYRAVPAVASPQRVAVNLGQVDLTTVHRGMTLASPGSLAVTRQLDVRVDVLADARPLQHGRRVRLHLGTTEVGARLAVAAIRPEGGTWHTAGIGEASVLVPSGGSAYLRLRLDTPVATTRLDRFVLRAGSPLTTVGGGLVLDPEPAVRGLRRRATVDRFTALDPAQAAGTEPPPSFLVEAGARGLSAGDLVRRVGLGSAAARMALAVWERDGHGIGAAGRLYDRQAVVAAESRVVAELTAAHDRAPADGGMARETLRGRLARGTSPEWFDLVVARLVSQGVVVDGDRLALAGRSAGVPAAELAAQAAVEAVLRQGGLTPPDLATTAAQSAQTMASVERAVHALVKAQRLVRVGDLVFHVEALADLKRAVRAAADTARARGQAPELDVAAFKAAHGLSRKFAIPLLEWLDRERLTRRVGERRLVL